MERADIVASLEKKGFEPHKHRRDHDYYFFKYPHLTQPVFTKVSRGSEYRTIGDDLVSRMSKQLHLTRAQFAALVECAMEKPGYVTVLKSRGILRDSPPKS